MIIVFALVYHKVVFLRVKMQDIEVMIWVY